MINFYAEIARKSIHLSSIWIPFAYLYASRELMLSILIPLAVLALAIDFSRRFFPSLNKLINHYLGYMMRSEEKEQFAFSGATNLLAAASLTIVIFSQEIAIFALSVLMISDSCAAIVGRKIGKLYLVGSKSIEGSVSFFVSSIMVYYFFNICYSFSLPFKLSLISMFASMIVELFAKKIRIDDNFAIPLVIGAVLSLG